MGTFLPLFLEPRARAKFIMSEHLCVACKYGVVDKQISRNGQLFNCILRIKLICFSFSLLSVCTTAAY